MFNITCRCGASNKNFKFNIGDFYIEDCCEKAGYDALGNKPETGMTQDELDALTKDLDLTSTDLVILDNKDLDTIPDPEPEATKQASIPEIVETVITLPEGVTVPEITAETITTEVKVETIVTAPTAPVLPKIKQLKTTKPAKTEQTPQG